MEKKKIDPALNRARVKESMERRGTERLNIYLDRGTLDRIRAFGFKPSSFAKTTVLAELERLEKMKN
ncbi:MAG: hypothetical protein NC548_59930 [Lachnospiraceae bacterium]|nr:hypothetical protein [Lachnospiraceae bacterium]